HVSRCNDRTRCLHDSGALTAIGSGAVDQDGGFVLTVEQHDLDNGPVLLFDADVDPAAQTGYRVIDFRLAGPRGAAARTPAPLAVAPVIIDPSSEGAARAVDGAGVEHFTDDQITALAADVRADPQANFSELTAECAAQLGTEIARARIQLLAQG